MSYNNQNKNWNNDEDPPKSSIKFILDRVPGIILEPNPVIVEGEVIQPEVTESLERVRYGIATAYQYYKPFLQRNPNEDGETSADEVKEKAEELFDKDRGKQDTQEWMELASLLISHMIDIRFLVTERTFTQTIDVREEK